MVVATKGPRYLRLEEAADAVAGDGQAQIPIIDYRGLLLDHGEESAGSKGLPGAQDWGFFQVRCLTSSVVRYILFLLTTASVANAYVSSAYELLNHGVPDDVVEEMKANILQVILSVACREEETVRPGARAVGRLWPVVSRIRGLTGLACLT
ncbi:hypothetical protein ACQ4PT_062824 [Festuca glaucescens]